MVSVATGGPQIKTVNAAYKREHRALGAALRRLGIDYPNKFDDLWRWHGRWSDGSMPSYRDRRTFIAELFAPARQALAANTTRHTNSRRASTPSRPAGLGSINSATG
jgi:hypothetical protein